MSSLRARCRTPVVVAAVCTTTIPGSALAGEPALTGIEAGWRTGLVLPMGDALVATGRSLPLGDIVTAALPMWIDAGYRLVPHAFVGAYFEYARALPSPREGCPVVGVNCSASSVLVGAQAHYHLMPGAKLDPWAGLGLGFEILNVSSRPSGGSFTGWQLALDLGADYRPRRSIGIGPFITFALGQFYGCSSSTGAPCNVGAGVHEWLTIGIKVAYDVHLGG